MHLQYMNGNINKFEYRITYENIKYEFQYSPIDIVIPMLAYRYSQSYTLIPARIYIRPITAV